MARRLLRWGIALAVIPLGVAAAVVAAYALDRAVTEGEVARNVTFEGRVLTGLGRSEVEAVVSELAAERVAGPLDVVLPDLVLPATAADLGIVADVDGAVAAVLAARRETSPTDDFRAWWRSWSEDVDLSLQFRLDPEVTRDWVAAHPERIHRLPVEPWFTGVDGRLVVQDPVPGQYLEAEAVVAALEEALGPSYPPAAVSVTWASLPTQVSEGELTAAVAEATELASLLPVVVNDRRAVISAASVRRWIDSERSGGTIRPVFVPERAEPAVERLLADLSSQGEAPTFAVVDEEIVFELGVPAYRCCAPGVTSLLFEAARDGEPDAVELPTRLVDADAGLGRAEALGVTELVAEFTTRHQCCQSRVSNIQHLADMVRGQLLEPGERFSINEFVGRRTREKGFVAAGTIIAGHFVDDVGGGISQFATTMFNAAFFAGLDFDAYRSHTIYISRYPYGREATLSYPQPDLAIVNNTPYGVLLWTKYTGTSITVQIYSTPYWDVRQTRQSSYKVGACTRVDTYRERTAPDGTVLEDMVFATYRPGEGIDCRGRRIPRP